VIATVADHRIPGHRDHAAPTARWSPEVLRTSQRCRTRSSPRPHAACVRRWALRRSSPCAGHHPALGGVVAQALRARVHPQLWFIADGTTELTRSWPGSTNANEFAQTHVAVASALGDGVPLGPLNPANAASRSAKILGMTSVQQSRRTRCLADLKAEALARWVTRSSERRLRSVMRGRLRGVMLWQIFRTIRQRAQPDTRVDAVVEFRITGRRDGGTDRHQIALIDGRGRRPRRDARKPALTLELEPVAFLRLVGGTASAERLLIAGKLKLRGDLLLALALPRALRVPRRRPPTPPKH